MFFNKMYDLEPSDWNLEAALIYNDNRFWVVDGNVPLSEVSEHVSDRCDHCNHRIKHVVILTNGNDHICIGWNCYNETFCQNNRQALDMARARKLAEARAQTAQRKADAAAFRSEHAALVAHLEANSHNRFYASLLEGLDRWGNLSERQLEAAQAAMERDLAPKPAEPVAQNAPSGRVSGIFEVLSVKVYEDRYGFTEKMVKMVARHTGEFYKIFVTVPGSVSVQRGDKVQMSVDLTHKDDDPTFAWGKRPTKAEVVAA